MVGLWLLALAGTVSAADLAASPTHTVAPPPVVVPPPLPDELGPAFPPPLSLDQPPIVIQQESVGGSGKRIVVDLASQTLTAYEGDAVIMSIPCSTGRKGMSTPRGNWPIKQKLRMNRALPEYGSAPIPYSLRLDIRTASGARPRIAIHQYKSVPRYPASHGCIRVRPGDASRLFEWAEVGVVVTVQ